MKLFLIKYKKTFAIVIAIYISFLYYCDYEIPLFDKHPDWKKFPSITTNDLILEEIKNFDKLYKNKYQLPGVENMTDTIYKTNLKNIKSIGFRVTNNELSLGDFFNISKRFRGIEGGNSTGQSNDDDFGKTTFIKSGYEYLQLNINNHYEYFKYKRNKLNETQLSYFYQYNYPQNENDTLFFNYVGVKYRAYIKK